MFAWVNKKFVTGNPYQVCLLTARLVRWRTGVYHFVCFPVSNERTYDTRHKNQYRSMASHSRQIALYQFALLLEESKACAVIMWSIFSQILRTRTVVMGRLFFSLEHD